MRIRSLALSLTALLAVGCSCDFFDGGVSDAGTVNGGIGAPCASARNCRTGLVCDPGTSTCQPSGAGLEGEVCVLTGDCGEGLYCGSRRTCEPAGDGADGDDCSETADCAAGLQCVVEGFGFRCRTSGDVDLGGPCIGDLDCVAGLSCLRGEGGASSCLNPPVYDADGGMPMPPPIPPFWPGETCEDDDGNPTAYFHIPRGDETDRDFYRLPFPNDVRITSTGLDLSGHPSPETALSVDVLGRHIEAGAEDLDGFSTTPVVYFRFSRPYEWADINADRVLLVDIDPGSPDFGTNRGRAWLTTAGSITRYICPNWFALRRDAGDPLRPGTTYAVLLMRGIRTNEAEGHEDFARAPDLDALLSDTAPSGDPLAAAHTRYQLLRDWLADPDSPSVDDVLNATVFTTQTPTEMMPLLRQVIRADAAPTISDVTVCADGVVSPCDDGGFRTCGPESADYYEIHARISLPQFQQGTPPYEEPEDGGNINIVSGLPTVARSEDVCMLMTIPKAVTAAPPTGFPVLFYAHGTGGAFTTPLGLGIPSEVATGDGGTGAPQAVTIAIDMPLHGSRAGDTTRTPDVLFFNFTNPRAARDNHLQGSADLMSLVYWAETFVLPAADAPTDFDIQFDPARMVLLGHSQGATHAMLMTPFEPGLAATLISGGGGSLTTSLLTKTRPVNIAGAVPLALLDVGGDGSLNGGSYHPALQLFQMFYDRVDPVTYGRHYRREPIMDVGHHVFMVYGLDDTFTPEQTQGAFARAAGMPVVNPELVDIGLADGVDPPLSGNITIAGAPYTIGLRQYRPNPGEDGHFVSSQTTEGRADSIRFLLRALNGDTPTIGE